MNDDVLAQAQIAPPANSWRRGLAGQAAVLIVAAVLFAAFSGTQHGFATGTNVRNIFMQVSVVGVVAIGGTMVMLTRALTCRSDLPSS